MKEIIGKAKHSNKSNFPQKVKTDNEVKTGEGEIANQFKKYFADAGPSLAKNIADLLMSFEISFEKSQHYLTQLVFINRRIESCPFYLKTSKSSGADEINFNVIKHCFGELYGPLSTYLIVTTEWGISGPNENHYSITCI